MTVPKFQMKRTWLWLLLCAWLIALQSAALTHSTEHALEHEHEHAHCLLCNVSDNQSAGPSAVLTTVQLLQRAEFIAFRLVESPALPWLRKLNVRAPPFLF